MLNLKNISREFGSGVYVANESKLSGSDLLYFDKVIVNVRESKDVYYFNMSDGRMFVYRPKLSKVLTGCIFVRDREEYDQVYDMVQSQGYANMPANIFVTIDQAWESRKAELDAS